MQVELNYETELKIWDTEDEALISTVEEKAKVP